MPRLARQLRVSVTHQWGLHQQAGPVDEKEVNAQILQAQGAIRQGRGEAREEPAG